jgi:lysophospholipase L1-like esterase
LAISIYIPHSALGGGIHYSAEQTSYIGSGNQVSAHAISEPQPTTSWIFLEGVDMETPYAAATLVTFGDSITDGARSTPDTNRRWPNILATRLLARKGNEIGIVDAGIGGNRILHDAQTNIGFGVNALARFDRDALGQPGVKYVVVMEGINDLGHAGSSAPVSETVSADDLIGGMQQMIEKAHDRGVKIYGATLTPFEGTVFAGYFSTEKEQKRKALNEWIRTGNAFDGVIDFDKAVRDPEHPDHILPAYDSGDHLHPSDAGYKAMADSIDLKLFK